MYYAPEDVPCTSRTTTLNEELGQVWLWVLGGCIRQAVWGCVGAPCHTTLTVPPNPGHTHTHTPNQTQPQIKSRQQVQYVLSDKTGTLTQNVMGFVWASIGGVLYGQAQHAQQAALRQASSSSKGSGGVVVGAAGRGGAPPPNTPHTIALDPQLQAAAAAAGGSSSPEAAAVQDFLLALAVCNTVVPTATETGQLLYQVCGTQVGSCCSAACCCYYAAAVKLNTTLTLQRTHAHTRASGCVS
jgi:hypothetical protein